MTEDLLEHECDVDGKFTLNSFWGGPKNRRCVQFTIHDRQTGCVQMTYADAKQTFRRCIEEIEKIEAQYDESPPWWEKIQKKNR